MVVTGKKPAWYPQGFTGALLRVPPLWGSTGAPGTYMQTNYFNKEVCVLYKTGIRDPLALVFFFGKNTIGHYLWHSQITPCELDICLSAHMGTRLSKLCLFTLTIFFWNNSLLSSLMPLFVGTFQYRILRCDIAASIGQALPCGCSGSR